MNRFMDRKTSKGWLAFLIIALVSLGMVGCGSPSGGGDSTPAAPAPASGGAEASDQVEAIEMIAATINPDGSLLAETLKALANEVEELSGGAMKITVFPGGQLGGASSLYQSVISGDIDIIYSDTGWFAEHNPVFNVLSTNYLFEGQEHFESIVNEPGKLAYFEDLLIESPGLKTIMYAGGLERNIISTFPIESIEDLRGKEMRSGGSQAEMQWWRNLGANPTTIDFNEVYTALQTGVTQGSQNSLDAMIEQRFGEVARYVARTQHNLTLGFVVMNNDRFESLSDAQKDIFEQAANNIQAEYIAKAFASADEAQKVLENDFGVTFTNPDREGFIEASRVQMTESAEELGVLDIMESIFYR